MTKRPLTTVLIALALVALFGASVAGVRASRSAGIPVLAFANNVPADAGGQATVAGTFTSKDANVGTVLFQLRFNAAVLSINPADANSNSVPDAIKFYLPTGYVGSVDLAQAGDEGRVTVTILTVKPGQPPLPDGKLIDITFDIAPDVAPHISYLVIGDDPSPLFATSGGLVLNGIFQGGSVAIGGAGPTATPPSPDTPTPTATIKSAFYLPALMLMPSPTPSSTPTTPPTATPTATPKPPTPTATSNAPTSTPKPPKPTPQPTSVSPTATPQPACNNLLANSDFEGNGGWQINDAAYPAVYFTGFAHSGSRSMRMGITAPWENQYAYSSIEQAATIPAGSKNVKLRFWLKPETTGTRAASIKPPLIVPTSERSRGDLGDDAQMVLLYDQWGVQHTLMLQRENASSWQSKEFDLTGYAGQRVTIYFGVYNNGWGGITAMYLDDATLTACK